MHTKRGKTATGQPENISDERIMYKPSDLGISTEKPKFPQYAVLAKRLETFNSWPEYLPVNKNDLVTAGLVYTGVGDSVKCYHCGGGLRNWEREDIPMDEHAKWYPKCPHVLLVMGKEYVERIGRGETAGPEKHSDMEAEDQRTVDDHIENIACKSCLEMNFSEDFVRKAAKFFIAKHGHLNFKAVDIAQICFDMEENPAKYDVPLHEDFNTLNNVELALKSEGLSEDDESIEQLQQEHQRLKENKLCKICLESNADVIFLPCGHMVCCPQCAPAMNKCPICRKPINGQIKAIFVTKENKN